MSRVASRFLVVLMATLLATGWLSAGPSVVRAVSPDVVISEVYGGGGNSGATLKNDFIELYNRGASPVSLNGYSVQYASAAGTTWQVTNLTNFSLQPGQNYLVQQAAGAGGTVNLPTPDASGSILMSATSAKVALVNSTTALTGACPTGAAIVDFVGYGSSATCFEGSGPTPTLSNTTAALRAGGGATDTDNNAADFTAGTPDPHNSGRKVSINDVTQNEGPTGSGLMHFTVSLSEAAGPGGVTFDIATQDDTATTADGDYILRSLTGQQIAEGLTSYDFAVTVNGDTKIEPDERFFVNVTNVTGATIFDGQGVGTLTNDDSNPCDEAFMPIYSIQGSGSSAAIPLGTTVTTEGIVVGDFEGTAANSGFFIQDATGDANAATSDGIFVLSGSGNLVSAGRLVRITGVVREPNGLTALTGGANTTPITATNLVDCGTGAVSPTDVSMPFDSLTFPERWEGMLVRFPQELRIAEYFNYDRFGEMVLALPLDGEDRPFTGTAKDEPGAAANARMTANLLRRITLDDNQSAQNPPILRHPNGGAFSLGNLFRGGDKVMNAVGVLGFAFGLYRIHPTAPADYTSTNPRVSKEDVGGSLKVAAMNTLNFFLTLDYPSSMPALDNKCGPLQNVECRGADFGADPTPNTVDPIIDEEFPRQRAKLIEALAGLEADVLGLNELENSTGVDPLGDPEKGIVSGLNDLGVGPYDYIDTGVIGTDAIRVGLIFRSEVVKPIGDFEILTHEDDPRFDDSRSRPALAQTFEEIATGARFTVVVNHLKSKGDSGLLGPCTDGNPDNDVPDCDQGDGQSFWNATRTNAAKALVDWIANDPTGSGDPDFLIMGDLNSYAMEDPIDAIKAGEDQTPGTPDDWTNLIAEYVGEDAYSFVFDGQSGYLDHALANPSIASQVTSATEWHINADEPDILDYDVSFKPQAQDALFEVNEFRTSDHDPVIVGLDLVNEAPTIAVTAGNSCSATGGAFEVTVDDNEVAAADLTLSLEGNTNPSLVTNVVFGGSGASRTVTVTVADRQIGTAVLTIGVNDGFQTVTTTIAVQAGGDANDTFVGTSGADLLLGNQGGDNLAGLSGADVLCGGQGADVISGGDGNDAVDGSQGDDVLSGGDGNDRLTGGQGIDVLTGGAGADAFSGGTGIDVNTDFNAGDGDTSDGT